MKEGPVFSLYIYSIEIVMFEMKIKILCKYSQKENTEQKRSGSEQFVQS